MSKRFWRLSAAIGLIGLAAPARADEGMWTFDNFPASRMREALGWAPDAAWLARVMAGSVRLENGCSGAIVSGTGLTLTNHHCVSACINARAASPAEAASAFMARAREEEARCAGMVVQALESITDVTARINAIAEGAAPEGFAAARDAEIVRIENECTGAMRRCEVVTLYQGGRYALYRYRHYDDVRLVFAPEEEAAYFGGESDNFNFPRHCLDFAFLRLYAHGAPAATPQHLSMRFAPIEAGEIVLAAGNPGATSRLMTSAQLAFQRDHALPWRLASLAELRGRLAAFAARGPSEALAAADTLLNVENSLKALAGRKAALMDGANFARVLAVEADLQARVRRNRAAQRAAGDAWGEIARAQGAYRGFYLRHQLLEARAGAGSHLFAWARAIVRGGAEREKPEAARLQSFAPAHIGAIEAFVLQENSVDVGLEETLLAAWLADLRSEATTRSMLGGQAPEALAQRLATGTQLADPAERRRLWEGGQAAVAASTDPLILFVRGFDEEARALDARYVGVVAAPVASAEERIAQARFRAFGDSVYPDANFSPRLSYGRVTGWSEADGSVVAPFTHLSELYERATDAPPYRLAPAWREARGRLDAALQFNLVSDTDIMAGNSGSPLLDRDGAVIGVVFDGNAHALGGEYLFDGARNRAVSLAGPIMRAALADVYGMRALLAEIEGR